MRKISLIVITCFLLAACQSSQEVSRPESKAVPVLAKAPSIKDVAVYIESIGTLRPSVYIEIRPQVHGVLKEVLVNEGQWVHQGDSLFKIDSRAYEIQVQEAVAHLAMDRVTLQAANKKLDRFKSLVEKDLVSQTEWDELESQAARAEASLDADEANHLSKMSVSIARNFAAMKFKLVNGVFNEFRWNPFFDDIQ